MDVFVNELCCLNIFLHSVYVVFDKHFQSQYKHAIDLNIYLYAVIIYSVTLVYVQSHG